MLFILALQLFLPLMLIGWLAMAPPRSVAGFWIQTTATALALLTLALTGLWLFPPWRTPYAFAGLLVVALVMGWRRRSPFGSRWPFGWLAWGLAIAFTGLGAWGTYQSTTALSGRAPQAGTVVELAFPLKSGEYLVVNGGSHRSVNAHLMTLDASTARFQAFRGQSYGVDIVKLNGWGLRASGLLPPEPSAYFIYNEPVYAPCTGEVVAAQDGLPDMQIPQVDREHMAGNHVLLRCKQANVLLGHFKPGSLSVAVGDQVSVGSHIAAVGNSGNTSEPHLHVHAQQAGTATAPFSGTPLPVQFDGRFLLRNDRVSLP